MGEINSKNTERISQIPLEVQLQICKDAALAFGYLCKTVCERFGQEGVKVIEESFLSDSNTMSKGKLHIEENHSKDVGMALIKLLASWGISKNSC